MFKRNKNSNSDLEASERMNKGFLQATNYLNSHLNPEEFPLYRAHLSWIPVFIHQIPFMIAGGIIGGIVWGTTANFLIGLAVFIAAWVIGVIVQIPRCYSNISTDILLTNQGIHSKKKLIAVEDDQFTPYAKINDAELNYHSILQRLLQYGEVHVSTISGVDDDYIFKNLAKPMTFKNACRAAQQKYSFRASSTMNAANSNVYDDMNADRVPTRHPASNGNGGPRRGRPNRPPRE